MKSDPAGNHARQLRHLVWRALGMCAVFALVAVLMSVDAVFAFAQHLLDVARPVITKHPLWGGALFVLLSAMSAMLAFFSSAVLVPVATYSWGRFVTIALLWLGWLLGGVCAYGVGRFLGRPLVRTLASARLTEFYLQRLPAEVDLPVALLIQLALPSEIPGYLLGVLRVRFGIYLTALAVVELPFAVGTVLLGESIVRRQGLFLLGLSVVGIGASLGAVYLLRGRLGPQE